MKLFVIAVAILFSTNVCVSAERMYVEGTVTDASGKGVSGVQIRVYCNGNRTADTRSHADGSYKVELKDATPIDAIRFDHSEWHPGLLSHLQGKSQNIHKVIHSKDKKLSKEAAIGQLLDYEHIYWLERLEGTPKETLKRMYAEAIGAMAVDPMFQDKSIAIFKLYIGE